jgi:murein DD-endopeptidase MepM/ murein hydrolase activator NlpD
MAPGAQIAVGSVLIAVAIALCYLSADRIGRDRRLADKETAVLRAETANADLQDEVASLRDKLALALHARDQAEERSSALKSQADSLRALLSTAEAKLHSLDDSRGRGSQQRPEMQQLSASAETASMNGRIVQLTQALEQSQRELHQVEGQRATLAARLSKAEADRAEPKAGRGRYKARLETATKKLQQASADRDKAISERDRLRARIAELEQRHSQRETLRPPWPGGGFRLTGLITPELVQSETNAQPPQAVITDAPPEPGRDSHSVAEIGRRAVTEFRRVLASTGLNIERLFPQFGAERPEGGPFVPPPKADQPGEISQEKLEAMRSLIKSLPLAVPLDRYQLESRFGPRRDPFNRRLSFHTGIDLSAPYMSPVYATAAGTVTYTGYRSEYGKVIEIDHGNGISTLYGHLHRYVVSVGQRVAEHDQIGYLGSTGRSSGPHVHYEVLVNDEPQDPEKFIGLARVIPAAEK